MQLILSHNALAIKAQAYVSDDILQKAQSFTKRQSCYLAKRVAFSYVLHKVHGYKHKLYLMHTALGKPYLEDNFCHFSFSDSYKLVAIAYDKCELGLDIEHIKNRKNIDLLASKYLSKEEYEHFLSLNDINERCYFFIKQWTIYEAIVKYFGLGIGKISLVKLNFNQHTIDLSAFESKGKKTNLKLINAIFSFKSYNFAISLCANTELEYIYYVSKKGSILKLKASRYIKDIVSYTIIINHS